MKIQASKQVGPVYYMVKEPGILGAITENAIIRTSMKAEPQSKGGKKYHYVSFMRDLSKADRNPNRWIYGVRIDGDKLSERYKINPFSYAGNAIKGNQFRVKKLTAYDNGTYVLNLVDWPSMNIPKEVYEEIEQMIVSDSQGLNKVKKLRAGEGTKSYRGRKALMRYEYPVKTGGIVLNESTLSAKSLSYLLKNTNLNETEERIWVLDTNMKFINIRGCITGYIEPKGDNAVEEMIEDGDLPDLPVIKY